MKKDEEDDIEPAAANTHGAVFVMVVVVVVMPRLATDFRSVLAVVFIIVFFLQLVLFYDMFWGKKVVDGRSNTLWLLLVCLAASSIQ